MSDQLEGRMLVDVKLPELNLYQGRIRYQHFHTSPPPQKFFVFIYTTLVTFYSHKVEAYANEE